MSEWTNCKLTGRFRYRQGWFGKLILQVQETGQYFDSYSGGTFSPRFTGWRDARIEDLSIINTPAGEGEEG